jgi:hypothetical protein
VYGRNFGDSRREAIRTGDVAGIAKAFDCLIATKGWSRPDSAIQALSRECLVPDLKAVIAHEAIIVRRSSH